MYYLTKICDIWFKVSDLTRQTKYDNVDVEKDYRMNWIIYKNAGIAAAVVFVRDNLVWKKISFICILVNANFSSSLNRHRIRLDLIPIKSK